MACARWRGHLVSAQVGEYPGEVLLEAAELGAMADREVLDDLCAAGRELDEATAVVQFVVDARDQPVLLRAIHQPDDAVSLALQGVGEVADRRISLARMSTDRQEELVLGRGDALGPCCCLGEREEPPQPCTEPGERLVVAVGQLAIAGAHGVVALAR